MNAISIDSTMSFKEKLKKCSEALIKEDGITLVKLILSVKNGIFALSIIPYVALYCRSVQEFFGEHIIDGDMDSQINDLRNGLKLYSEKYNKLKNATLASDEQQNNIFKSKLKFKTMQDWNIHYNLGIYFDKNGYIIGNTQIMHYYLNLPDMDIENENKKAFEIGKILGKKLADILNTFYGIAYFEKNNNIVMPQYGYMDLNTNRENDFFVHNNKELNLIILHILSSIGFVNHILSNMLTSESLWLCRIKYIITHYAWSGLKKIKQHYECGEQHISVFSENLNQIINYGTNLFPSNFRNCMMHYNFFNKDDVIISEKYFCNNKPLFGLVESCFDGKSFDDFFSELSKYLNDLENQLLLWVNVDIGKIKRFKK